MISDLAILAQKWFTIAAQKKVKKIVSNATAAIQLVYYPFSQFISLAAEPLE